MSEQTRLNFRKPTRAERLAQQNLEAARVVLEQPDLYGAGLLEWARRVLDAQHAQQEEVIQR